MKVGVIITCKNLVEYTAAAVDSIFTQLPHVIIIIDDHSIDKTKEWAAALPELYPEQEFHVITDPVVPSLAARWNLGCRKAFDELECTAALVCNNDILFNPITIDSLAARMRRGDVGMVTAHNLRGELADPEQIFTLPVTWEATEAQHPDFSCFLISKDTYQRVGDFDENFIPCYFEDGDYHLRMGKLGIKAITTTGAPYYHYGSRTQNSVYGGVCTPTQFDTLREYLRGKHGAVPGEAAYERICQGVKE